uniref:Uncharacterized protein n=1 Tax=Arundo donax TaxID=35708 RepID=A0A0A8Y5E2_ARUDO
MPVAIASLPPKPLLTP